MERASTIEQFLADPIGRYSIGPTHLVWCHSRTLAGSAHWGRPSEADAAALAKRLEISMHSALDGGFDVLMDASAMEIFDWPAFRIVSDYAKGRLPAWSKRIKHHAIVVPSGVASVFVAALMPLLGANHPLRFFPSIEDALEWLRRDELGAALDELRQIIAEARGVPPLILALRQYLDANLAEASLDRAAHRLGLSARSLQRELQRQETQFTLELLKARVRVACLLLSHSEEKIDSIARRVGCASSSQLSVIFRRMLGQTPNEFRTRHRP